MKALNFFGILVSIFVLFYNYSVVLDIRTLIEEAYAGAAFDGMNKMRAGFLNIALNGAFLMILTALFCAILYGANLKNIKRNTTKIISILGLVFSMLMFLVNCVVIALSGDINLGVIFLTWCSFGLLNMAFCIVLLVQAVRAGRGPQKIGDKEFVLDAVEIDDFEVE